MCRVACPGCAPPTCKAPDPADTKPTYPISHLPSAASHHSLPAAAASPVQHRAAPPGPGPQALPDCHRNRAAHQAMPPNVAARSSPPPSGCSEAGVCASARSAAARTAAAFSLGAAPWLGLGLGLGFTVRVRVRDRVRARVRDSMTAWSSGQKTRGRCSPCHRSGGSIACRQRAEQTSFLL